MSGPLGVVPAAGVGSRLWPYRAPKELIQVGYLEVAGRLLPKAAIEHVLCGMRGAGARDALVVTSPTKFELPRYLASGSHLDMNLAYLCQEDPLGMPHALDLASPFATGRTVLMGMPDTIVSPHDCFTHLLAFHKAHRGDLTLGVFPTDDPRALAPVVIEHGSHRVLAIVDKPDVPPVANTWGMAVWEPSFTDLLHDFVRAASPPRKQELLLTDAFVSAIAAGLRVHALTFTSGRFHDIGTPAGLMRTRELWEHQSNAVAWPQP
jgi:glucose-1-phosphate thymidylyltransferase